MFIYLFVCLFSCCIFHGSSFIGFICSIFAGKSVMTKPPQKRQKKRPWTPEEDNKLKHFKTEYPNLPWGEIIELAKLERDVKSCSERWNNHLKSDFNKEKFSPQEDERIIYLRRHDVG